MVIKGFEAVVMVETIVVDVVNGVVEGFGCGCGAGG